DHGKPATSWFKVAAHLILPLNPVDFRATASPVSACSAFAIRIRTGRRHQIRAHLLHSGFPTLVDCKYAAKSIYIARLSKLEEAFLQAGCPQE
ncbi:unnamed protein product, partial [Polarella glacialis]